MVIESLLDASRRERKNPFDVRAPSKTDPEPEPLGSVAAHGLLGISSSSSLDHFSDAKMPCGVHVIKEGWNR